MPGSGERSVWVIGHRVWKHTKGWLYLQSLTTSFTHLFHLTFSYHFTAPVKRLKNLGLITGLFKFTIPFEFFLAYWHFKIFWSDLLELVFFSQPIFDVCQQFCRQVSGALILFFAIIVVPFRACRIIFLRFMNSITHLCS